MSTRTPALIIFAPVAAEAVEVLGTSPEGGAEVAGLAGKIARAVHEKLLSGVRFVERVDTLSAQAAVVNNLTIT